MNIEALVQNLKEDEEIKAYYRQFFLAWFWQWLGAFVLFLSPFFLLYLFLRYGPVGQILLAALFVAGAAWLARVWRLWQGSVLVVTTHRLVMVRQKGIFDRTFSQISLDKINDVSFRQKSFWQTFFNYGAILVQISASPEKLVLLNIRRPHAVQQVIFDLQRNFGRKEHEEFSEAELLAIVREIRNRVGEQRWREIIEGEWELKQGLIDEVHVDDPARAQAMQQFFKRKI